jgi:ATP-dependent DNA helicase PIF1
MPPGNSKNAHSVNAAAYPDAERTWQKRKLSEAWETGAYAAPPSGDQKHRRIELPIQQTHNAYPPISASHAVPFAPAASQHNIHPPVSAPCARPFAPTGSQHNPLEIPSSPEQEPRKRPLSKKTKKFYAVAVGRVPGIYDNWEEAQIQVKGYHGNKQRGFKTKEQAEAWLKENRHDSAPHDRSGHGGAKNFEFTQRLEQIAPTYSRLSHARATGEQMLSQWDSPSPHQEDLDHKFAIEERMRSLLASQTTDAPMISSSPAESIADLIPVDPEPILKPEQQKVVDLILQGHNVFYTGSAGCGKSTILKAFVKQLHNRGKRVKIVAPTNLAALNVGGITTWSFAGWTPDKMKKSLDKLMQEAHGKEVYKRFDTTDVLVIDEISMVENLLFERLNHIMKAARSEKHGPGAFGNTQVVVTGDVSWCNQM